MVTLSSAGARGRGGGGGGGGVVMSSEVIYLQRAPASHSRCECRWSEGSLNYVEAREELFILRLLLLSPLYCGFLLDAPFMRNEGRERCLTGGY